MTPAGSIACVCSDSTSSAPSFKVASLPKASPSPTSLNPHPTLPLSFIFSPTPTPTLKPNQLHFHE